MKIQICIERNGESAILIQFYGVVLDMPSSVELENFLTTNFR